MDCMPKNIKNHSGKQSVLIQPGNPIAQHVVMCSMASSRTGICNEVANRRIQAISLSSKKSK